MPCRSACPRSALLQQLPLRPLNRLSPKRLLSRFSSLEPYLCLTHSFSALPPEHRLDGAFPNRWTRAKRRGDRPAVGCAVPFYRSDRPRSPGPPPPNGIVFRFYPAPPLSSAAPFRRSSFPAQLLSGAAPPSVRPVECRRAAVFGGFLRRRRMRQKSRAGVWYPVPKGGRKRRRRAPAFRSARRPLEKKRRKEMKTNQSVSRYPDELAGEREARFRSPRRGFSAADGPRSSQ